MEQQVNQASRQSVVSGCKRLSAHQSGQCLLHFCTNALQGDGRSKVSIENFRSHDWLLFLSEMNLWVFWLVAFRLRFFHKPLDLLFQPIRNTVFDERIPCLSTSDENRRRRIVFRSMHRGIREMDIVVGNFVKERIDSASTDELDDLERILEIPDQDLLAWLTGAKQVPPGHNSRLLELILASRFDEEFFGNLK
jgi:antitoxin CptB